MSVLDFIKIYGLDGEPTEGAGEFWEVFQGIGPGSGDLSVSGSGGSSTTIPATPLSEDSDLADQLWEGQNARIEAEIDWLGQIQSDIKAKQQAVQNQKSQVIKVIKGIISKTIGKAVDILLMDTLGPFSEIAGFVADLTIGWLLDKLQLLLQRGNALIPGMISEYESLLELDPSQENYDRREDVITRHREDIRLILDSITDIETQITDTMNMDNDAIVRALQDLAYQDVMVDFGAFRAWIKSRMIEYAKEP